MENKYLRRGSLRMARFVRDELEDLHCEGIAMTDENMPRINTAIRQGIYRYLAFVELYNDPELNDIKDQLDSLMEFIQPPQYWEEDCFDEVDKDIRVLLRKMKKGKSGTSMLA